MAYTRVDVLALVPLFIDGDVCHPLPVSDVVMPLVMFDNGEGASLLEMKAEDVIEIRMQLLQRRTAVCQAGSLRRSCEETIAGGADDHVQGVSVHR